ncbi:MAG TPA: efflux transporter outer membrane subunit [Rhizomicrobium sp.]|jgi:NodT family efflux transporter outer membrane factor (OMF) lipoprotein|nr:efflux transporter outer membrane subunit [Rhizomicrobium sp.]
MKILLQSASVAVLVLMAAGCSTQVPQVVQTQNLPSNFTGPVAQGADVWPNAGWWKGFNSDELNTLVAQAQTDNFDLAAATARVLQARASAHIAGSALFPTLSADASATRSRSGEGTVTINPLTGGAPTTSPSTGNQFGVGLQASYELDIWGRAQDDLRAADETLKSSKYARQTVALTTVASVATTYLDVLALRERVSIAQQNIDAAKRILTITQAKVDNGVSSRLDLAQQQALVAGQEAQIPAIQEQEKEALFALAVLLGRMPEGFDVTAQNLDAIKAPLVAPGMPSQLLSRRPDVAEAEAALASGHANVDAARAAFFPQIGLTGSGGYASNMIKGLINPGDLAWSVGASLLQTIFDGGALWGAYDLTKGQQLELIADYRKAVVSAFSDVETSLNQVAHLAQQEDYLTQEVNAASEAFRISEIQYREGVADLLTVLQSQQTLFTAQDTLIQIKLARVQADVGLFKALGGGWSEKDIDATQTIPAQTTAVPAAQVAPAAETNPETPVPATPGPSDVQPGDNPPAGAPTKTH